MADRSKEFWTPEPIFPGETVFCLGGGPGLRAHDVARISGRPAIAINASAKLAPWAPVLFFMDHAWFEQNRALVAGWPGLAVTMSRPAKGALPDKVRRLIRRPLSLVPGKVSGRTSGHVAVSLAIAFGARRIVLLGYDMRMVDGRSHYHDDYCETDERVYSDDYLQHFRGWNAAALDAGVTVLNATVGSALTEFPMVSLDDVLAERV